MRWFEYGCPANELKQLGDSAGLTVAHHERTPSVHLAGVQRSNEGISGVIDVGGVYQRVAMIDEEESSCPGSRDYPSDQLLIAWTPDEVRPYRAHRKLSVR
jgi:hypothetical protein